MKKENATEVDRKDRRLRPERSNSGTKPDASAVKSEKTLRAQFGQFYDANSIGNIYERTCTLKIQAVEILAAAVQIESAAAHRHARPVPNLVAATACKLDDAAIYCQSTTADRVYVRIRAARIFGQYECARINRRAQTPVINRPTQGKDIATHFRQCALYIAGETDVSGPAD